MSQVAPSIQEISTISACATVTDTKIIPTMPKKETVEDKTERGLKAADKIGAEELTEVSLGCTVTANTTNSVANQDTLNEFVVVEENLVADTLPLKRPPVYIPRPKPRLVRRMLEPQVAPVLAVAKDAAQYPTPPPSNTSASPPRKDVTPDSPKLDPIKQVVAPRKLIYQSTGIQTLPPGNSSTFEKIYGRSARNNSVELDSADMFTSGETGLSAMGRFGKDIASNTYDLIYGRRFRYLIPTCSPDVQDQGFQVMDFSARENAIKKARVKAAMQVNRLKPWMDKFHYKAFPELRENMIVHSEQVPQWVEIDKNGQVDSTAPFPNVVCTETYSTGPPESISVVLTRGDDADIAFIDEVTNFIEYPMPDSDTEDFVVRTVQTPTPNRLVQNMKAPRGGKTRPPVASHNTKRVQSATALKATVNTIEREHRDASVVQEDRTECSRLAHSTGFVEFVLGKDYTTNTSGDAPAETGPTPSKPMIRHPPREESTLSVVPPQKGLLYSSDSPRFGPSKTSPAIAISAQNSRKTKRTSKPLPTPRTQLTSASSSASAAPQKRTEKQTNGVRKITGIKTNATVLGPFRKDPTQKVTDQLPNALFGAFLLKTPRENTPVSQSDTSALPHDLTDLSATSTPSSALITAPSSPQHDSRASQYDSSCPPNNGIICAPIATDTIYVSLPSSPIVPLKMTLYPSSQKRSRHGEDEDLVDYSDSKLIPSPKKQHIEGYSKKHPEQATDTSILARQPSRNLESIARVAQQYPPPPPLHRAPARRITSAQDCLQQRPPQTSASSRRSSRQPTFQLQITSLQASLRQTPSRGSVSQRAPTRRAPKQQSPSRRVSSNQTPSQELTQRDTIPEPSISQPTRHRTSPQGMWARRFAGTGLL
jgi:hypothetical protein